MTCTICNHLPCVCPEIKKAQELTRTMDEATDILKMKADLLSRQTQGLDNPKATAVS